MYVSPAMIGSEIGDHDVTTVDGRIHLHHLCLPNQDGVGHAVSDDALSFAPAPAAVRTGDPGACDDDMIWTMHTIRHPRTGLYLMYYTACSLAEQGQVQRVALATSPDFVHWTKHPGNPVLAAASPYLDRLEAIGRVPFRDPFVFVEDDGSLHMLVCAQTAGGDRLRRGCVAHAVSEDGFAWRLLPPLYAPGQFDDLETPALIKRDGRYYLFLKEFRGPRTFYRIADRLEGPWRTPEWDEPLPPDNAVIRFCEWKGKTLAYTWFRCKPEWPFRGPALHAILPPKEVQVRPDGRLRLASFEGWDRRRVGSERMLAPAQWKPCADQKGAWNSEGDRLVVEAAGLGLTAVSEKAADFIFECEAGCTGGRSIGFVFRADDAMERGNWIRLDFERRRVEYHRLQPMETGLNRLARMQPSLRQQWDYPLERGSALRVKLLVSREYIELSLDGQVVLSLLDYVRTEGRLGLFAEDAAAWFSGMRVQAITPVKTNG